MLAPESRLSEWKTRVKEGSALTTDLPSVEIHIWDRIPGLERVVGGREGWVGAVIAAHFNAGVISSGGGDSRVAIGE